MGNKKKLIKLFYFVNTNDKHMSDNVRQLHNMLFYFVNTNDKHCQTMSDSCITCYFTLIQQYYSVNDKCQTVAEHVILLC